ncbi:MAG: isopeptide-forming domain-containing fimbrial protein [Clostridia bacterium]
MAIDISQDLNIFVQVLATETATLTGAYDTGFPAGTYLPGKDFSPTDNVSSGAVTSYQLGISLTSKTNQLYSIDKLFLQSLDDPNTNGTGAIPFYLLNTDPNASNVTDDGLYTLLPGYAASMASVVFGPNAGVTSTSTVTLTLNVNYPNGVYWKTKIAPKIQAIAVKNAIQQASAVFRPPEVLLSSYATYTTGYAYDPIAWNAIRLGSHNGGSGFFVPFYFPVSQTSVSSINKLLDTPSFSSIDYSTNLRFTLDGKSIPLSTANVVLSLSAPTLAIASYSLSSGGQLNVRLTGSLPQAGNVPWLYAQVFLPYVPGNESSVTMVMNGAWNPLNDGGVRFNDWQNRHVIGKVEAGGIQAQQVIPLKFTVVPNLQTNVSTAGYQSTLQPGLLFSNLNFISTAGSQLLLLYHDPNAISNISDSPPALLVQYSTPTQSYLQYEPPTTAYRQQYGYTPFPAEFNPNAIADAVFSGAIPVGTYQQIASTGNTPNLLLTTILTDILSDLPYDPTQTLGIFYAKLSTQTISSAALLAKYQANPAARFTSWTFGAMRLGTNLASVASANARYGNLLGTGDQFLSLSKQVFLSLASSNTTNGLKRFNMTSTVRYPLSLPVDETYFITSIADDTLTPVPAIYDYTATYHLRFFIQRQTNSKNATLTAGMPMTFAVPPAVLPYLYLAAAPGVYRANPVPVLLCAITDYSLSSAGIRLTVPQTVPFDYFTYVDIPVQFLLSSQALTFSHSPTGYDLSKLLLNQPNALTNGFPANTAYYSNKLTYASSTLQSAGVDFAGLTVIPPDYPSGTAVTFIATVKNQLNLANDLILAVAVPTNQYNPLESSNNLQPAFIQEITTYDPGVAVYYQRAATATPADIAAVKLINQPGSHLGRYFAQTIVNTWTLYHGGALPSDVVMLAAYAPQTAQGALVRMDYTVAVQMHPDTTETYINNAAFNYYSTASDTESQSNAVTIQNYDLNAPIVITKSPATQQISGNYDGIASFDISFTVPTHASGFQSLTFTDQLPPALTLSSASTLQIGTAPVQPLNASFDNTTKLVSLHFPNPSSMAGKTVTIQLIATVQSPGKIPATLTDVNQAFLIINANPALRSPSNIVNITYAFPDLFQLHKQPLFQNNPKVNGTAVVFQLYFNVPQELSVLHSLTITDVLPAGLSYDPANSLLQIGTSSVAPLNATLNGQTVTINLTSLSAMAGQTVMISLATVLTDSQQLPASNTVQNSASLQVNSIPLYTFPSNTVTAAFGALPAAIPIAKAPVAQTLAPSAGTAVRFTLTFPLPADTTGYGSLTITDTLASGLTYHAPNSTLQFGSNSPEPLNATLHANTVTVELNTLAPHAGEVVKITLAALLSDPALLPPSKQISNSAELMVNHDATLASTSNTVTVTFGGSGTGKQAINDLIESIALEQTAVAHILNAEGEKIQATLAVPGISCADLLAPNASVEAMIHSITNLEIVFHQKLKLVVGCICRKKKP